MRDLGGLLFIDVRDRAGVTQVVFDKDDEALIAKAKRLRSEFVVGVVGKVRRRSAETVNPKLPTGEVEIVVSRLAVLNEAKTPPFPIADETPVSEDVRLKYRYLDLRRPRLQNNIILRHRADDGVRRYFDEHGFLEIETPILTKSTPEGARDYLVPSRVHPGEFFALPQSPQLFKQILMIAGMDRYVQICKCFRDEDLRADRQPEFTQVDVEMSFARPETIFGIIEPLMARDLHADRPRDPDAVSAHAVRRGDGEVRVGQAGPAVRHADPGLRRAVPRVELPRLPRHRRRAGAPSAGSSCRTLAGIRAARLTTSSTRKRPAGRHVSWARRSEDGTITSSIMKAVGEEGVRQMLDATGAAQGGLLFVAAGEPDAASKLLGQLRLTLAKKDGLLKPDDYAFTWVVDFPLLEWDPEEKRYAAMHHPFTSPLDADIGKLEHEPGRRAPRRMIWY